MPAARSLSAADGLAGLKGSAGPGGRAVTGFGGSEAGGIAVLAKGLAASVSSVSL